MTDVLKVERGQLWSCGRHRVMCGDSTSEADVLHLMQGGASAKLFATDPPYGVAYKGSGKRTSRGIDNDDVTLAVLERFLSQAFGLWDRYLAPGAVFYICHAHLSRAAVDRAVGNVKWKSASEIVWVKQIATMGWQDFRWRHEPIIYGWKPGEHYFCGDRTLSTVWWIERNAASRYLHPTQKPVELFARMHRYSSRPGDVVAEPFLGSGTQLIAAEQANRTCYAMELDESFCAAALARWQGYTRQRAELMTAA